MEGRNRNFVCESQKGMEESKGFKEEPRIRAHTESPTYGTRLYVARKEKHGWVGSAQWCCAFRAWTCERRLAATAVQDHLYFIRGEAFSSPSMYGGNSTYIYPASLVPYEMNVDVLNFWSNWAVDRFDRDGGRQNKYKALLRTDRHTLLTITACE